LLKREIFRRARAAEESSGRIHTLGTDCEPTGSGGERSVRLRAWKGRDRPFGRRPGRKETAGFGRLAC
jgi:hypothetical protein